MPRTGGVYYLPSPPSPYVPGTLAAAEDINTTLNDLAVALTGSLPTDGSAAMTGALNANGHPITGVSTLQAGTLTSTGTLTTPTLTVSGGANIAALIGSLNANGQNITGAGTVSGGYLTSTGNVNAAGQFTGSGAQLSGNATVNGTLYTGATQTTNNTYSGSYTGQWMEVQWIATSSDVDVGGNVNVTGGVQGPWSTIATIYGTSVFAGWQNGIEDCWFTASGDYRYLIFQSTWGVLQFHASAGMLEWQRNGGTLMKIDYQGNMAIAGYFVEEQGPMAADAETAPAPVRIASPARSLTSRVAALEAQVEQLSAALVPAE